MKYLLPMIESVEIERSDFIGKIIQCVTVNPIFVRFVAGTEEKQSIIDNIFSVFDNRLVFSKEIKEISKLFIYLQYKSYGWGKLHKYTASSIIIFNKDKIGKLRNEIEKIVLSDEVKEFLLKLEEIKTQSSSQYFVVDTKGDIFIEETNALFYEFYSNKMADRETFHYSWKESSSFQFLF